MIVTPKIRNNICLTAHPKGCAEEVRRQIKYVKSNKSINGTKSALIIGSSTGYGLSCRIAAGFGCGAATIGVFYERPGTKKKIGTPGYYNMKAFEEEAKKAGLFSKSINGDAFSNEIKEETIKAIKEGPGKVDLIIYSLASGVRVDPADGVMYRSVLKPIGTKYKSRALNTMSGKITNMEIEPADKSEIENTVKVMGGDDWQLWINALLEANVLAKNAKTTAFSYIGPEITKQIYRNGTIGAAKKDLEEKAKIINNQLASTIGGSAFISVNKAVVTRAAAVIPAISLYITILFKVMKKMRLHEGCVEQMDRFFRGLYTEELTIDEENRVRMDDWEMRNDVQAAVNKIWQKVKNDNVKELVDVSGYHADFMNMHGFEVSGVNYEADVEID